MTRDLKIEDDDVYRTDFCTGPNCGEVVYFVSRAGGGYRILNGDGVSHFKTCPDREMFGRQRSLHD